MIEITSWLRIDEDELVWKATRASGPGGQHVNKTSTCVVLRHAPSGITVKAARERSQSVNRFLARRILCDRFEEMIRGAESRRRQEIEKLRRQKRKRSKRAKEKMLDAKKHQARKKSRRGRIMNDE